MLLFILVLFHTCLEGWVSGFFFSNVMLIFGQNYKKKDTLNVTCESFNRIQCLLAEKTAKQQKHNFCSLSKNRLPARVPLITQVISWLTKKFTA